MPTHLYITRREPPRFYDILLAHALEVAVAAFSAVVGTMVLLNYDHLTGFTTTPLQILPTYLVCGIGAIMAVGGCLTLSGVLVRRNNIRVELNVEQAGWIMLAAVWACYGWAAIYFADGAAMSYLFGAAIALGSALRAAALFVLERELEIAVNTTGGGDAAEPTEEETDGGH